MALELPQFLGHCYHIYSANPFVQFSYVFGIIPPPCFARIFVSLSLVSSEMVPHCFGGGSWIHNFPSDSACKVQDAS